MDLQKWMTRFQLTGNRLIESWMDLLPEALITSPEASLFIQRQRQDHEADQVERAQVAAADTRRRSHMWSMSHGQKNMTLTCLLDTYNENRRQAAKDWHLPIG